MEHHNSHALDKRYGRICEIEFFGTKMGNFPSRLIACKVFCERYGLFCSLLETGTLMSQISLQWGSVAPGREMNLQSNDLFL